VRLTKEKGGGGGRERSHYWDSAEGSIRRISKRIMITIFIFNEVGGGKLKTH